jgi:hypothetical protein
MSWSAGCSTLTKTVVILSEAKDLLFAAGNRSFASLRMTI